MSIRPRSWSCMIAERPVANVIGTILSNPVDLRVYLTERQFKTKVLRSKAWAAHLRLPPIAPFDEAARRNRSMLSHRRGLLHARGRWLRYLLISFPRPLNR